MKRIIAKDPAAHDSFYTVHFDKLAPTHVRLWLWDSTGESALVYLTRAKAERMAADLLAIAVKLPRGRK